MARAPALAERAERQLERALEELRRANLAGALTYTRDAAAALAAIAKTKGKR